MKSLWITASKLLFKSCEQELKEVMKPSKNEIAAFPLPESFDRIKDPHGVLFTTYYTLSQRKKKTEEVSSLSQGEKKTEEGDVQEGELSTRLLQIVDWLGKDFDGPVSIE